jgi:hypothetical protein
VIERTHRTWKLSLLAIVGSGLFAITWPVAEASKPGVTRQASEDAGKRPGIPYSDLNWKYDVLGKTGRPLGELVTLQGQIVEGPTKGYEDGPTIRVQRINGIATQDDIAIKLEPFFSKEDHFKVLKIGTTYELRGYESGKYVGTPGAAMKEAGTILQTTSPYFGVNFVMLRAKEVPEIRFGPEDFLNRVAVIEGTARTKDSKGYLVGPAWKLLALEHGGWPKHMEGKAVEAEGVMRGATQGKDVFRLDHGKSRLVRLEDQLGREVELSGQALSMNGYWWFQYRGVDLYVEDMDKLPNWSVYQHGKKLVIAGLLDEAMLPRIDQITLKEDRDLKKYFIVRKASWRPIQQLEVK